MSLYQRPLRSDELMHWGKGNHKYIDKVKSGNGWKYFYTMEELKAFRDGTSKSIKNTGQKVYNALGGDAKRRWQNRLQRHEKMQENRDKEIAKRDQANKQRWSVPNASEGTENMSTRSRMKTQARRNQAIQNLKNIEQEHQTNAYKISDAMNNSAKYYHESLDAYKKTPVGVADSIIEKAKDTSHSFDRARKNAINRVGGAKDRVKKALAGGARKRNLQDHHNAQRAADESVSGIRDNMRYDAKRNNYIAELERQISENVMHLEKDRMHRQTKTANNNARYAREDARSQSAADRITNERREAVARKNTNARYAREDARSDSAAARIEESNRRNDVHRNNNNSRYSRENSRSQQTGQKSSAVDRISRNANIAGRNLSTAISDAGNAISKGYDNDVRKPLTRVSKKVSSNTRQAGQNLSDAARDAHNAVTSDVKKRREDISRASKSGADYVSGKRSAVINNANQARENLTNATRDAQNALKEGYDRDIRQPANKIASNARHAGSNLVNAFRDAGTAIAKGYDEDIRKRRKRR